MKYHILFFLFFTYFKSNAYNLNTLSVNSIVADKSLSTLISLQPTLTNVFYKTDFEVSLDAAKYRNQVNYNSNVEDFIIEKTYFSTGVDITWNSLITFGISGSTESVNKNQVRMNGITSNLKVRVLDFSVKAILNDRYIRQVSDFIVLGRDIKNQLTLRNTKKTLSLAYYGFNSFIFSLIHTKYEYDSNPTSANTLLSTSAILQKQGASFISQIYTLIDYETSLDINYSLTEKFDLEIMASESIDYLDPYVKSNEYRLGGTYYFDIVSLGMGVTGLKTDDSNEFFYSSDITLSYEF